MIVYKQYIVCLLIILDSIIDYQRLFVVTENNSVIQDFSHLSFLYNKKYDKWFTENTNRKWQVW